MTEPTADVTEKAAEQPQEGAQKVDDLPEWARKEVKEARREAAKYRTEAQQRQARLEELEAANLSELEKAQKAANEATARLAEFEKTTIRQRVALTKGVPADLVDRLRGDTEDEIAADADALMALVTAPKSPRPDPSQGPRTTASGSTADQFAAAVQNFL